MRRSVKICEFLKKLTRIKPLSKIKIITTNARNVIKRKMKMSSNNTMVPEAQDAMNRFKMEAANEVGVNLKQGYNGDLTSKQAGSIGGQMVKKMIKSYEESMK